MENLETWFIERPTEDGWRRYAGAFDDYERAKNYFDYVCPRDYRITQYFPEARIDRADSNYKRNRKAG